MGGESGYAPYSMKTPPSEAGSRVPPRRRVALPVLVASLLTASCMEQPRTYASYDASADILYEDGFTGEALSPMWFMSGPGARLEAGHLHTEGLKNHPVWLKVPLPDHVEIEFDTWSTSDEGDIKFELAGDGKSAATTANYRPTGYVFVFGGWNNRRSVLARLDEHDPDRITRADKKVNPNQRYHMKITRLGANIVWEVDGKMHLRFNDPEPLAGRGHEHFAFGGWESPVNFDNLVIRRRTAPAPSP